MGGINEAVINPPVVGASINGPIRIHQKDGEVHLHDDKANKKFACPVADFYKSWKAGKTSNFEPALQVIGHDGKNNPIVAKFEKTSTNGKVDVAISFEPVQYGDTISKIDNFVAGR